MEDFDNGCNRCDGQGLVRMGDITARCPRCIVRGKPANPAGLPPFAGGQGRSDDSVQRDGEGALLWLLIVLAAALIVVIFFTLIDLRASR